VDAVDATTGAITIGRGCIDTVPVVHAVGARIWFAADGFYGVDPTLYTSGATVYTRLLTRTTTSVLDIQSSGIDSYKFSGRQNRPYPPANIKINGLAWPDSVATGDIVISWSHRDRVSQGASLIDQTGASVGPETGVSYVISIYSGSTLKRSVTVSGTTWTYTAALASADGDITAIRIVIAAIRDGLYSLQVHDCTVVRLAPESGYGKQYGKNYGGA
jgi:hypothetical protein